MDYRSIGIRLKCYICCCIEYKYILNESILQVLMKVFCNFLYNLLKMNEIGDRLKKLIKDKGLTPYKVSLRTKISQATLSRIINKNSTPNESNTKALVDFFGVSESWLLTGEYSANTEAHKVTEDQSIYGNEAEDLNKELNHLKEMNDQLKDNNQTLKEMISILEDKIKDLKNQNSNFQENH